MKIERIEAYGLLCELEKPFGASQGWIRRRQATLVRVVGEDGIDGWGEAQVDPVAGPPYITSVLAPGLIGRDPFDSEVIWESLYNGCRNAGGFPTAAISGVDIALWDLKGKYAGLPVCKLLGGAFRSRLKVYATGFYYPPEGDIGACFAKEARKYCDLGFRAMKMKIGMNPKQDVEMVQRVREVIGPDICLMADANHAYDVPTARSLVARLKPFDLYWLEEPILPEDLQGYLDLKGCGIAIAGGELSYTRFGFRDIISHKAMDVIQPDVCIAGGITELRRISALASTWGVQLMPHVWGTAVALAASVQLIASLPECPPALNPVEIMLEFDQSPNPLREEVVLNPIAQHDGFVDVGHSPGLGVEMNLEAMRKYQIAYSSTKR